MSHTLYRFFAADNKLLYVGRTANPSRRFKSHSVEKDWWENIAHIKMEHFPDAPSLAKAEVEAIKGEKPQHNVQHNNGRALPQTLNKNSLRQWRYKCTKFSGVTARVDRLYLYPELEGSSMVDDYWDEDGAGQFKAYYRYLERKYPQWLEADAVPIYWTVEPSCETAPFQQLEHWGPFEDFLTVYSWPEDPKTGERLDWYKMPVINDRFPKFAAALNWTPAPLQRSCPLRTIMQVKMASYTGYPAS